MRHLVLFVVLLAAILGAGACTRLGFSDTHATQHRAVTDELNDQNIGEPSVKDFLATCDVMSRDMVCCAVVQHAKEPVVVEIKPVENKTSRSLDLTIYPQTIRGMILKQGNNRIAFRDETARKDIIAERSDQSDDPVHVTQDSTYTTDASRNSLGGVGTPASKNETSKSQTKLKKNTAVSGRIAETDYFLNGFIYAANETRGAAAARGYRYYRFQFRLTDARTGLVVWENDYEVKKAGLLAGPAK